MTAVRIYQLPSTTPTSARRGALLFCHAAGFLGHVWGEVSRRMTTPMARFAFDLRGHGQSPPLPSDARWDAFGGDVLEAAAQVSGGPVVGVGHSLGGTALLLAEAQAPCTFAALHCFEPILAERHDPSIADGAVRRTALFANRDEARRHFALRGPLKTLAPPVLTDYVEAGLAEVDGAIQLRCAPQTEAQVYRTAIEAPWRDALPQVACPTTLLNGSRSAMVDAGALVRAASAMPHARVRTLDDLGHLGPLEQPEAFARYLDEALCDDASACSVPSSRTGAKGAR